MKTVTLRAANGKAKSYQFDTVEQAQAFMRGITLDAFKDQDGWVDRWREPRPHE